MSTPVPPPISAAVALGPITQILPAQYRFPFNYWAGETAFLFTFYTVLPTFDPVTGAVLTAGQVRDLTGCTFSGTCSYRPRPVSTYPDASAAPPASVSMPGQVDPDSGQASLTLPASLTGFARQDYAVWTPDVAGFESAALLEIRANLTDSLGFTTTQGIVPLFIF